MKRLALLFVASCSFFASSKPRPFPEWSVAGGSHPSSCARVEPWVVRSGKEGIGFVLESTGTSACTFTLEYAELVIARKSLASPIALPPAQMSEGAIVRTYISFAFDNERAWNRDERVGTLVVHGTIDGQRFDLDWPMTHAVKP